MAALGVTCTLSLRSPRVSAGTAEPEPWAPNLPDAASLEAAFAATDAADVRRILLANVLADAGGLRDDGIFIDAPRLAEDGAVVPLGIATPARVHALYIIAPPNPVPLVLALEFPRGASGAGLRTRIRLAGSATLEILAATSVGWQRAAHPIDVARGGCVVQGANATA